MLPVCEIGGSPRIVGPQTAPVEETLAPGSVVVGVRFQPGAARSLLVPGSEIVDLTLQAVDLWGSSVSSLGEAVANAASPDRATSLLEAAVAHQLPEASALDPVVNEAVQRILASAVDSVGSLASSLHVSERHLRRRCEAAIGLSPRSCNGWSASSASCTYERPSENLARLAAEAGYADQSHLTRESLRLHGLTPLEVTRDAETNCTCAGHDHAASYGPLLASA